MTLPGMSAIKRELKAAFTSPDFAQLLADVAALYPDGLVLEPPRHVYRAEKRVPDAYPCITMLGAISAPRDAEQTVQDYTHRVGVFVWLSGDDEEMLTDQIEGYLYAIREFLWRRVMPAGVGAEVTLGRENYDVMVDGVDTPFLKVASIEVIAPTYE